MKYQWIIALALVSLSAIAGFQLEYPTAPDPKLTPGSLCRDPDSYRYPEKIPYCERDHLSAETKNAVLDNYRRKGFRIDPGHRSAFKIDHLIPLCAGGSNNIDNLWPQHKTIYEITDPLEPLACKKLSEGRISQRDLVNLIIAAKKSPRRSQETMVYLQSL